MINGTSWLAGLLSRDSDGGLPPERRLFLAVVGEALVRDTPAAIRSWLRSRDGRQVCALAGLDPDWLIRRVVGRVPRSTGERRLDVEDHAA